MKKVGIEEKKNKLHTCPRMYIEQKRPRVSSSLISSAEKAI